MYKTIAMKKVRLQARNSDDRPVSVVTRNTTWYDLGGDNGDQSFGVEGNFSHRDSHSRPIRSQVSSGGNYRDPPDECSQIVLLSPRKGRSTLLGPHSEQHAVCRRSFCLQLLAYNTVFCILCRDGRQGGQDNSRHEKGA